MSAPAPRGSDEPPEDAFRRFLARLREPHASMIAGTITAIVAGLLLGSANARTANSVMLVALVVTGIPVVFRTLVDVRRGQWATDLIATLAIVTAAIVREPLAGLVIVLMRSGGELLERRAAGRASAALRELEAASPRIAHRLRGTGESEIADDVAAGDVVPGDRLLIRAGDLVPCDAVVLSGHSLVDTSRLTGEPLPKQATRGTTLHSGAANGHGVLVVRATARASESEYAKIVELVRSAQSSRAPLARLADRYAVWFTPLTILVCVAAYLVSHDWKRVLAVLVVATPCPLILAVPVAMIGGVNRAARRKIIVRSGNALESLSTIDTAVFDKTGTLTIGRPVVREVRTMPGFERDQVLRLSAAVDEGSSHLLARSLVEEARTRLGELPSAHEHVQSPGRGIAGVVDGHRVAVGGRAYVAEQVAKDERALATVDGNGLGLRAYVAIDGHLAGVIEYADRERPGLREILDELDDLGVHRRILLSGDHVPNVHALAYEIGITDARGDLMPDDKARIVRELEEGGASVAMVGDGVNDAPALSTARVGIALAATGGGISAEAADVVLLSDDLRGVPLSIRIARRTLLVARQSIWLGLGLSGLAMAAAFAGRIPPTAGAILQEVIDIISIVNALRASGGPVRAVTVGKTLTPVPRSPDAHAARVHLS